MMELPALCLPLSNQLRFPLAMTLSALPQNEGNYFCTFNEKQPLTSHPDHIFFGCYFFIATDFLSNKLIGGHII